MGIVVNGQLYRGLKGIGAKFGHLVIVPGGAPCRCSKRGCIDACKEGKWQLGSLATLTIEEVTDFGKQKNG